jgi:signal transduction histidine kinase
MTMNLLDISRSDDGALTPKYDDVALLALLEQVRGSLARRASVEGRGLTVTADAAEVHFRADPELLQRVVENLIDNCLKYTPRGSAVTVRVTQPAGWVRVTVLDEGAGIPIEQRERIFDRYAQLEGDGGRVRQSRGLGLTSCKLAVEAQGGKIWVEGNGERGSAFIVELPH